jgi:hypothetical protein
LLEAYLRINRKPSCLRLSGRRIAMTKALWCRPWFCKINAVGLPIYETSFQSGQSPGFPGAVLSGWSNTVLMAISYACASNYPTGKSDAINEGLAVAIKSPGLLVNPINQLQYRYARLFSRAHCYADECCAKRFSQI